MLRKWQLFAVYWDENSGGSSNVQIKIANGDDVMFTLPRVAGGWGWKTANYSDVYQKGSGSAAEINKKHSVISARLDSMAPYNNSGQIFKVELIAYDCELPYVPPKPLQVSGESNNGKSCELPVDAVNEHLERNDWIDHTIKDLLASSDIKGGQGTVLRARNSRSGTEGGLLLWSDGVTARCSWNPFAFAKTDDWRVGDEIVLLDVPRPDPATTRLASVSSYKTISGRTGWNLDASHIQFGKSGLVGSWWKDLEVEMTLPEFEPVVGVGTDSVNLPYTIHYYDETVLDWKVLKENVKGSVSFSDTEQQIAPQWRLSWLSTILHSTNGLSTYRSGGGIHAQLLTIAR